MIGFGRAFDRLCLSIRPIAPRASRSIVGSTSVCSCSFSYRVPPRGLDLRLPAFRFSGTRGAHTSRRAEARRALGEGSRPRALVSSSCAALPRSRRERRAPRVANARKTLSSVFALFLSGKGIDFPKGTRTPRARVSVPRPTPRGDELWLAQRMREVGGRVSSREREATEARGKARASVFGGVVGRAATRATRGEVHRDGKRSENAPESRSSAAESRTSLSSRVSSQTRTFRSPSVTSSGRVTFTVTPSPFDPRVRRRILLTKTKKKPPRTATNATTRNVALARRLSRASTRSSPPTPPRGTSRVPTRVPTAKRQQSAP